MEKRDENCKESYKETDAKDFARALEALTLSEVAPLSPTLGSQIINLAFERNFFCRHAANLTGAFLLVKALRAARIGFRFEVFSIRLLEFLKRLLDKFRGVTARNHDFTIGNRKQALGINFEHAVDELQVERDLALNFTPGADV